MKLEEKTIYDLVKLEETLISMCVEEVTPIAKQAKEALLKKIKELDPDKNIVGKCYVAEERTNKKTQLCYYKATSFNPDSGLVSFEFYYEISDANKVNGVIKKDKEHRRFVLGIGKWHKGIFVKDSYKINPKSVSKILEEIVPEEFDRMVERYNLVRSC